MSAIEAPAGVRWPDAVDEILGGDQALVFAYATPARGVVLTPVTNFALRDRDAGTLSAVNSSVGAWKKLERLQRNPRVAVGARARARAPTRRLARGFDRSRLRNRPLGLAGSPRHSA